MTTLAPQPLSRHAYEALLSDWSRVFNALLKTKLWKLRQKMDRAICRAAGDRHAAVVFARWTPELLAERQRDPEAARLEARHSEIARQIEAHREALGLTD